MLASQREEKVGLIVSQDYCGILHACWSSFVISHCNEDIEELSCGFERTYRVSPIEVAIGPSMMYSLYNRLYCPLVAKSSNSILYMHLSVSYYVWMIVKRF